MRVGIIGAGAVGGYLGMLLSAAGASVIFIERQGRAAPVAAIDVSGRELRPKREPIASSDVAALSDADICLVTVKSFDTNEVAGALARSLPRQVPVVSFQNGLENVTRLRSALGDRVAGGVVSFNVRSDGGLRRQLGKGRLLFGRLPGALGQKLETLASMFELAGQSAELRSDIAEVMAGKLLLNLNNGICAATNIGIAKSLTDPDARWCYAQCIREGVRVMRLAGLHPARVAVIPADLLWQALSLPDRLLNPLIRRFGRIAETARSSTLQDLDRNQRTEIDELNGAIVQLASGLGLKAPANQLVTAIVHDHERAVLALTAASFVTPRDLRRRMASALRQSAAGARFWKGIERCER